MTCVPGESSLEGVTLSQAIGCQVGPQAGPLRTSDNLNQEAVERIGELFHSVSEVG